MIKGIVPFLQKIFVAVTDFATAFDTSQGAIVAAKWGGDSITTGTSVTNGEIWVKSISGCVSCALDSGVTGEALCYYTYGGVNHTICNINSFADIGATDHYLSDSGNLVFSGRGLYVPSGSSITLGITNGITAKCYMSMLYEDLT